MGIPLGKLDLYTVCAGVDPYATVPIILDCGAHGRDGNTDQLLVRDHASYTGDTRAERMMLHADRLSFAHPTTGERLSFSSTAPF